MAKPVEDQGPAREAHSVATTPPAATLESRRARGRIVLGEGGFWTFLGPLAWLVAGLLLGDLFPGGVLLGGSDDWLPLLRTTFLLIGIGTFLVEAGRFERWTFDLDTRTLTWRHGLVDFKPRKVGFASLDRVRIVLEERGPEDYLVAVHVRAGEEDSAEAFFCGRGLPEEARERAARMQRLLDEVRRRAALGASSPLPAEAR